MCIRDSASLYYEALGRFVDAFSEVEIAAARALWKYADVNQSTAKIVFSGTRADQGNRYIKEILEITKASVELREDFEDIAQQFGVISRVRNDVLHYGASGIAEGKGLVSNESRAKSTPRTFAISPGDLKKMTADLRKILFRLNYVHIGRPLPRSRSIREELNQVLRAPWQYKFVESPPKDYPAQNPPD